MDQSDFVNEEGMEAFENPLHCLRSRSLNLLL